MIRTLLFAAFTLALTARLFAAATATPATTQSSGTKTMKSAYVRLIDPDGKLSDPVVVPKLILSDVEWKKRLTPEQFRITRGSGTEAAFCGGLLKNKEEGMYLCVGCKLPLFKSETKFESGTGWPSFFAPVAPENIREKLDMSHGMVRSEILCPRCDSHLGHVFEDGPKPTGLRYCLNSESLKFVANDKLRTVGEKVPDTRASEAVLAGGCFWCTEAVFEQLDGVYDAISGYSGGEEKTANYADVCTGRTGHAEVVKVVYDPQRISYEKLLKVHFATHDPTTLNRQGNDVGPQYRSAIFYADDQQKRIAEAFIADLGDAKVFKKPIVTTLEPLKGFYVAESHHQNYVCRNPTQGYIQGVALPKVEKVREKFKDLLKEDAPSFAE
jgi:peptide methionine sulfoxide reductase msrA/msrB